MAAKAVFEASGVDAPVREIADRAGVGTGTVYRHFPQRSDLIAAVFRREIDACAEAASALSKSLSPMDALSHWLQTLVQFFVTKRGLATALHSGDPAYEALPAHFDQHLRPALQTLLEKAVVSGAARADVVADDLLLAVAGLCMASKQQDSGHAERMVTILSDGLRPR